MKDSRRSEAEPIESNHPPRILASDIDGTLLHEGSPTPGLDTLGLVLEHVELDVRLVYATGRSFAQTMSLVHEGTLPTPDAIVSMVGTELWLPPWEEPDARYRGLLLEGWRRDEVTRVVEALPEVSPQPAEYQTPLKASYYCTDPTVQERIAQALEERGLSARVVWSAGKHLDLLPSSAGKRQAVEHLRRRWDVSPDHVLYSGDSGNDLSVLEDSRYLGVVVGNAEQELDHLSEDDTVHQADLPHAAGVLEGAERFGFWEKTRPDRG